LRCLRRKLWQKTVQNLNGRTQNPGNGAGRQAAGIRGNPAGSASNRGAIRRRGGVARQKTRLCANQQATAGPGRQRNEVWQAAGKRTERRTKTAGGNGRQVQEENREKPGSVAGGKV